MHRKNTTKIESTMSTPRQKHIGMSGTLDGRGNPVVGRPPPPTNWARTIDEIDTEKKPLHWAILLGFGLFFLYVV